MSIPAVVVDLDEPHAPLDQSPRGEAHPADRLRGGVVQAVEVLRGLRLVGQTDDLGDRHLHAEGQLVRLDPRPHRLIVGILDPREAVQFVEQIELCPALGDRHVVAGRSERERVVRIDGHRHGGMFRAEIAAVVSTHAAAAVSGTASHHDELRQVVVERSQPVMDPRPDRRMEAVKNVAAGVKLKLSRVVVVCRPHRSHDGDVIDARADVRPPVAHLDPALAALLESDLQRVQRPHQLARRPGKVAHVLPIKRRANHRRLIRRLLDRLPRMLGHRGFGIKALQMTGPTEHEVPDHAFGLRRERR